MIELKKSPTIYIIILAAWAVLLLLSATALLEVVGIALEAGSAAGTLVIASTLFIAYFWLNGTKDIVYTLHYHLWTRWRPSTVPVHHRTHSPRVVMVYCTFNDFSADSLARSAVQDYDNYEVVILDDSTKAEYRDEIDRFAAEHKMTVVRRADRDGFKAGNLNNYLRRGNYEYFVILDSDEVTPPNFINRCLDYFDHYGNVGIVQANHIATRNRNHFMELFAIGVDSHWIAYQSVKDRHGFLSLLGHGAMLSRACYETAGGFPMVVAEDLCMSIAARDAGFVTAFAPDIICEEEYPVDYLSFRKRHSKWTQGNMEFIKKFTGTILRSRMAWFEKLDIVLFTYSLPLTALFSLFVAIHVILLPLMGHNPEFPLWMLIPTVVFLVAPMLNDLIFHVGRISSRRLGRYTLHGILLYGSMMFVSLKTSIKSMFGKSVFHVTPKGDNRISFREAVGANRGELLFGISLGVISCILRDSILPVVLLVAPALASIYLSTLHHCPADGKDAGNGNDAPRPEAVFAVTEQAPEK
jgi:cellulose synthase/poly-beta-1,6-N-acetylglucosamine synthase-like glycosyltransferase